MLYWYWRCFWLDTATPDSQTRLSWSLSILPPFFPSVEHSF